MKQEIRTINSWTQAHSEHSTGFILPHRQATPTYRIHLTRKLRQNYLDISNTVVTSEKGEEAAPTWGSPIERCPSLLLVCGVIDGIKLSKRVSRSSFLCSGFVSLLTLFMFSGFLSLFKFSSLQLKTLQSADSWKNIQPNQQFTCVFDKTEATNYQVLE